MKAILIAIKDFKQSFRSAFALVFMFAVPLLVTGMFALMFGSSPADAADPAEGFRLPAARLVVANLDQGDLALESGLQAADPSKSIHSLGDALLAALNQPALREWVSLREISTEAEARAQVDQQSADAALIIPAGFSVGYTSGQAEASFYSGKDASPSAGMARAIVEQALDTFAGARIAVDVAAPRLVSADTSVEKAAAQSAQEYAQYLAQGQNAASLTSVRAPLHAEQEQPANTPLATIIAPIMSGMLIFFAFFTGGSTAQSILQELESGTLARLFSTPTRAATILQGKFLAVGLTVLVQVIILLIAAHLVFGIQWGALAAVALAAAGIITCAAAFGIFVTSLMKSTRQGGAIYGGLMTVTGMLGMLTIFAGQGGATEIISLLTPQGWAVRGLALAMHGAALPQAALNFLALLALSAAFLGLGVWKFGKRFA